MSAHTLKELSVSRNTGSVGLSTKALVTVLLPNRSPVSDPCGQKFYYRSQLFPLDEESTWQYGSRKFNTVLLLYRCLGELHGIASLNS